MQANRLLRSLPPDQPVRDQLEYGDYLIWKSRSTIKNAPGFYVYLLRQNISPPEDFETSARTEARQRHRRARGAKSRGGAFSSKTNTTSTAAKRSART